MSQHGVVLGRVGGGPCFGGRGSLAGTGLRPRQAAGRAPSRPALFGRTVAPFKWPFDACSRTPITLNPPLVALTLEADHYGPTAVSLTLRQTSMGQL